MAERNRLVVRADRDAAAQIARRHDRTSTFTPVKRRINDTAIARDEAHK
jgi:hypothetical protein